MAAQPLYCSHETGATYKLPAAHIWVKMLMYTQTCCVLQSLPLNQFTGSFSCHLIMTDMALSNASSSALLWLQSQIDRPLFSSCSYFFLSRDTLLVRFIIVLRSHTSVMTLSGIKMKLLPPPSPLFSAATYLHLFFFFFFFEAEKETN